MKTLYILPLLWICMTMPSWGQQDSIEVQEITPVKDKLSITQEMDKRVIEMNKENLDIRKEVIENKSEISGLFINKIGFLGIFASLLSFLTVVVYLRRYYRKKIDKDVAVLVKKQENAVLEVEKAKNQMILRIHNTEMENKTLRDKSKILIIGETATGRNDTLESIFVEGSTKVKFNCTYIKIGKLNMGHVEEALLKKKIQDLEDFQLVIIDNSRAANRIWEGDYHRKRMLPFTKDILEKNVAVLYFSDDQYFPTNDDYEMLENKHFLAFANAHSRVYTNTMELLKVHSLFS